MNLTFNIICQSSLFLSKYVKIPSYISRVFFSDKKGRYLGGMNMVIHRIKYRIGEKEFEIEGDQEFVEKWFEQLKKDLMKAKPVF